MPDILRYPWLVKGPDGQYTMDAQSMAAMPTMGNEDIPRAELHKRITIVLALNEGYVQLSPEPEKKLLGDQKSAWEKLRNCMVITANPYKTNKGEWMIYRMRLFTPTERRNLRAAIRKASSNPEWGCAEGCAGMMDELEMVNFESNGRLVKELKKQI